MAAVLDLASGLRQVGMIDKKTLRQYEALCAAPPDYAPADIVRIREREHVSQGFFARSLNVSSSSVQKWEAGVKRPTGSAAKLLSVVDKHGLSVLD